MQVMWLVVTEVTQRRHDIVILCAVTHIFAYWTFPRYITHVIFFHRRVWYRVLSLRCVQAMRVINARASSSLLGYMCANICSVMAFSAELDNGEKPRTQSLTHSLTHSTCLLDELETKITQYYCKTLISHSRLTSRTSWFTNAIMPSNMTTLAP